MAQLTEMVFSKFESDYVPEAISWCYYYTYCSDINCMPDTLSE